LLSPIFFESVLSNGSQKGLTALAVATEKKHAAVVKLLTDAEAKLTPPAEVVSL
jgi:hypothetical protein